MRKLIILISLLIFCLPVFAQDFSGAESYGTEKDDYLYDFTVLHGQAYQLIQQELLTYPEKVYGSLLHGLDITVNPLYMGNEYSSLKLSLDNDGNVYLAGIYTQKIMNDTSYMFVSKLDQKGKNVWTRLFEKKSDSIEIYNDSINHIYVHDKHVLYKIDYNGNLIWARNHRGIIKLYNNHFYKFVPKNSNSTFLNKMVCDSIILHKLDASGNQIFQKSINVGTNENSMLVSDFFVHIFNHRIFLSNSYWGKINVDPSNTHQAFENNRTSSWGDKWGNVPSFDNYLAIYDTLGNLLSANSKINFPRLEYACMDSAGSLYFAGGGGTTMDYDLKSSNSIIVNRPATDISFIAKYSDNLDFIWCRSLTGLIKYMGMSHYSYGAAEKLDIAGEYQGTIKLDFKRPNDITFQSVKTDLFYAYYNHLNDNISPTGIINNSFDNSLMIYPNPCKGILNIKAIGNNDMHVEIFDSSGKLTFTDNLRLSQDTKTIDVSHLEDGYYLMRTTSKNKVYTNKLLINK